VFVIDKNQLVKFPVRVTLHTHIQFIGKIWRLFKVCQLLSLFSYSDKYTNRSISGMKLTGKSRPTRKKNMSQYHYGYHKSHKERPGIESGSLR